MKATIKRLYLEKIYFKKWTDHSLKAYKKQKRLLQSPLQKRKEKLFQQLKCSAFLEGSKAFFYWIKETLDQNKTSWKNEFQQNDQKTVDAL